MRLALTLLAAACLWSGAAVHDFHVSRLTVNYDTSERRLELTLDTFVDDLEAALGARAERRGVAGITARSLDLVTETEASGADALLAAYLTEVLAIDCAGAAPELEVLGKEGAGDPYAMYVYLAAPLTCDDERGLAVTLRSHYLYDLFDDQQNIVVWQRDGESMGYDLLAGANDTARREL